MNNNTKYPGFSKPSGKSLKRLHELSRDKFSEYDTSAIRPKKSKKKKAIIVVVLLALVATLFFGIYSLIMSCSRPQLEAGQEVRIDVVEGATNTDIANDLFWSGLIDNVGDFLNIVGSRNLNLKAGQYVFYGGEEPEKIAYQLDKGSNFYTGIIVAKGDTVSKVAKKVESFSDGKISASEFIKQCSDASIYVQDFPFLKEVGNKSLEGFLFPKTYDPVGDYSADSLVREMLTDFQTQAIDQIFSNTQNTELSFYDLVTLASIVEKEATDETRKEVASVFINRIQAGMYIQSDATSAYELGHNPTADEVHANTPYSTYANFGLPPTPICSPSVDSLNAVCFPIDTNYLFFYFKDVDGHMKYYFSTTYEEHNAAIAGQRD
ncbi:MAG: endolytic transglycosylase MltG [Enterococcus sp.]|nr:endolytic transglycosylase MltG [Enterococcus sp.]